MIAFCLHRYDANMDTIGYLERIDEHTAIVKLTTLPRFMVSPRSILMVSGSSFWRREKARGRGGGRYAEVTNDVSGPDDARVDAIFNVSTAIDDHPRDERRRSHVRIELFRQAGQAYRSPNTRAFEIFDFSTVRAPAYPVMIARN